MKKIALPSGFLVISMLYACFCTKATAQSPMLRSELGSNFFLTHVEDGGNRLLSKYKGISLAYDKKKKELLMYGEIDETHIILLEKVAFSGSFNPDQFQRAVFSDGKISLCSQVSGKATVLCEIFAWQKESMKFEKEESTDLSQLQTIRADALLKGGKVAEALATYDSVQYADQYYDARKTGVALLLGARPVADELVARRKFKEAADLVRKVLAFKGWKFLAETKTEADLRTIFGKNLHGLTYNDFAKIVHDYCSWLNEARQYDAAIAEIGQYRRFFTDDPDYFLFLGDAWYGKKDKTKYGEAYQTYVDMMKARKKEKDIPYTVTQRLPH